MIPPRSLQQFWRIDWVATFNSLQTWKNIFSPTSVTLLWRYRSIFGGSCPSPSQTTPTASLSAGVFQWLSEATATVSQLIWSSSCKAQSPVPGPWISCLIPRTSPALGCCFRCCITSRRASSSCCFLAACSSSRSCWSSSCSCSSEETASRLSAASLSCCCWSWLLQLHLKLLHLFSLYRLGLGTSLPSSSEWLVPAVLSR